MEAAAEEFLNELPSRESCRARAIVVVGMAGSGKTTFVQALYTYLKTTMNKKVYTMNLDPAVLSVPFPANIDIRDTVDYKATMKQFGLGPNGAILTALNLFSTRFDQVLNLLNKRKNDYDYVLIDTPGQIEVFNWSASGTIILDSLALTLPTQIAFMIDTVRCQRASTLMSTMLYACSIVYKTKLPFLGVFTKSDIVDAVHEELLLQDLDAFAQMANSEDTYASTLWRSCSLVLAPFYESIPRCAVAVNGETNTLKGFNKLIENFDLLQNEYFEHYIEWVKKERSRIQKKKAILADEEYAKFTKDKSSSEEEE